MKPWRYQVAAGRQIKFLYASDPEDYHKRRALSADQRKAFQFFLDGVSQTANGRNW